MLLSALVNNTGNIDGVRQLCPSCGLCCNGVLFADVELQPSDDSARLQSLGLKVEKVRRKARFDQPCACFDGKLCRIYANRPARCRAFDCGVLKRVRAGKLTVTAALKTIATAQQKAAKVRRLLGQAGNTDEHVALTKRYSAVMSEPVDLSAGKECEARGRLMLSMSDLMQFLQREFRT